MATRRTNIAICWVVRLEGCCPAYVVADSWEQATVEAAKFWGIPWGKAVAKMELERKLEARKNVCIKCGRVFFGPGTMCQSCEKGTQQELEITKKRMLGTWYLGRKGEAFGT